MRKLYHLKKLIKQIGSTKGSHSHVLKNIRMK